MPELTIKILSYNIHKGFSPLRMRFTLSRLREYIRSLDLDLVFLQEIVGENQSKQKKIKEWPNSSQLEFLADSYWEHFAYGKNAVYQDGHHGNAILSKFPISEWENIDVSTNQLETRGIMFAKVSIPSSVNSLIKPRNLYLFNLHFNVLLGKDKQLASLFEFIEKKVPEGEAIIVSGDFNDWQGGLAKKMQLKGLEKVLSNKGGSFTFPAIFPFLPLDGIYFKNLSLLEAEVLKRNTYDVPLLAEEKKWQRNSDHLPIVAKMRF